MASNESVVARRPGLQRSESGDYRIQRIAAGVPHHDAVLSFVESNVLC
jgi:hypothetical protein